MSARAPRAKAGGARRARPKPAAARRIAFLRAINVGGHTVTMDRLRQLFETMGFREVETFIASGNVVFEKAVGVRATFRGVNTVRKMAAKYAPPAQGSAS